MKLSTLTQFSKNASRFTEIVGVLTKYGLANWIKANDPDFIKDLLKSARGVRLSGIGPEERLRMALTELGTSFIKLGQILSTRADLIGPAFAEELTKLQARTPPDDPEVVRHTVETELGRPLKELFAEFDLKAIGSASIGQVHQAKLHGGQTVVVKVQHAGIEPVVNNDLEILAVLADLAERYDPDLRLFQPRLTVAAFGRTLLHELDFRRELRNLQQFSRNFQNDEAIYIPAPYPELSSRRVLTMEMLEGFSIADTDNLNREEIDTQQLVRRGANMYLEMVFRDRFFHSDPHPGNIWVLPGEKLGLLDCGMTGRIDDQTREELEGMLLAAVDQDSERLTDHLIRITTSPQDLDRSELRRDIDEFLSEYIGESLADIDLSALLNSLMELLRRHYLFLPAGVSLLIRVLVMLEGTSRLLDQNFSLAELIQPFAVKSIKRRYSPQKLLNRLQRSYGEWDRFMDLLPREMGNIIIRMRQGRFNVDLTHQRLDVVVNRLAYAILSASFFLGGCMLVSRQIPPLIGGISTIGSGICILGLFLGWRLLWAIKKSGDLRDK